MFERVLNTPQTFLKKAVNFAKSIQSTVSDRSGRLEEFCKKGRCSQKFYKINRKPPGGCFSRKYRSRGGMQ